MYEGDDKVQMLDYGGLNFCHNNNQLYGEGILIWRFLENILNFISDVDAY